jgi:outer membrane lipoprotein SlyB
MKMFQMVFSFLIMVMALTGCAPNISANTYGSSEIGVASKVVPGVVISRRVVNIDNNSGAGGVAGTVAGAAAGSVVGGSPAANIVGAVGGAVVGGVLGNAADKSINHHTGVEYIIKQKNGEIISVTQAEDLQLVVSQRVLVVYGSKIRVIADDMMLQTTGRAPLN